MRLPKAILLDLDDTILNSGAADTAWRTIAETEADCLEGYSADRLHSALRSAATWFWSDDERAREGRFDLVAAREVILRRAYSALGIPDTARLSARAVRYEELRDEALSLVPGAMALLRRLRELPVRTALVTNGATEKQWAKIRRFALEPFFDHIQVEQECGVGKPDPRAFRRALASVDATPGEAWMVGDNLRNDIQGAQQVGMHAVWVNALARVDGGVSRAGTVRPDRVIPTVATLLE